MANPSIPLKLAMAQSIARRIAENPGVMPYGEQVARDFLANGNLWAKEANWETTSPCWVHIASRLPEILAKLAEIDGH